MAMSPEGSYSMETSQDGQPSNLQVPRRVHRWTILLRSVVLIMILAIITMDLLLLYFHNVIDTSWFSAFLIVLAIIGVVFSIAQLFYLWSFSNSSVRSRLPPVDISLSTEAPITLPIPSTESTLSTLKTTYRSIVGVV